MVASNFTSILSSTIALQAIETVRPENFNARTACEPCQKKIAVANLRLVRLTTSWVAFAHGGLDKPLS
jgi:hypothetical protein